MDDLTFIGKWLVVVGIIVVLSGGLIWLLGKTPLNQLPGTLKMEWSGVTCVFPILASILLSIILTVILNIILRSMGR